MLWRQSLLDVRSGSLACDSSAGTLKMPCQVRPPHVQQLLTSADLSSQESDGRIALISRLANRA